MPGEIDLSQFHEVFYEESFENLASMESGLLGFSDGIPDSEQVNTVFRAAHSIKGGAATFGFLVISDFTHVVETLLDQVRAGERSVTAEFIDIMLESVDLIRVLLTKSRSGVELNTELTQTLSDRLGTLQSSDQDDNATATERASEPESSPSNILNRRWSIFFRPAESMLKKGNEPFRMIRELKSLGSLTVISSTDRIPDFESLDPESCFVEWNLQLEGEIDQKQIHEVFEWVEDECQLEIEELTAATDAPADSVDQEPSVIVESGDATGTGTESRINTSISHPQRRAEDRVTPGQESTSIRVNISKIDSLIDLVGELVITQSMLNRFTQDFRVDELEKLIERIDELERNTRELQEHTMRIRMLPIDSVFQRLPRLVRDLGRSLGKEVELKLVGNQTEVDKTVLEKITDPLTHLIRNALDHGIELPEERKRLGKPELGTVEIKAFQEGGTVIIQISDDGKGLDPETLRSTGIERGLIEADQELSDSELQNLIFAPGFSTAGSVSDVSGRGVGMDVVNRNIKDLGGVVELFSEIDRGSTIRIKLPLTLAILDGQLVRVGSDIFIVSMLSIVKSVRISPELYGDVAGKSEVYRYQDEYIPIVRLTELFSIEADHTQLEEAIMVIVDIGQKYGILVDEVLGQQQVVIKSLESNYRQVPSIAGATILGDGKVAMILDPIGILSHSQERHGNHETGKTFAS
jgi:two-component system chemotaxis sensor kinase CheA